MAKPSPNSAYSSPPAAPVHLARRGAVGSPQSRVIRQLVEALVFEGLVEHTITPISSATREPVYDSYIEFNLAADRYTCVGAVTAFGRIRVQPGSIQRAGVTPAEPTLHELVAALPTGSDAKERLLAELIQTDELSRWNFDNLLHQHSPRRSKSFQELESAIVEGHLYHPSFKSRTGFTLSDHLQFGSEVGNRFQLQWLAIARSQVRASLPCDEATFWRNELGAQTHARLTARLLLEGCGETHVLMPVHPWQVTKLRERHAPAFVGRDILELGEAGDYYQASQSLRTLLNISDPTKANVKLPLDVICTSTHRNLRPAFVCTAPLLSNWLVSLTQGDSFLRQRGVVLLQEYAGMRYAPDPGKGPRAANDDGQALVGVLFRESVETKLAPGEAAVPFTALMLLEGDGRPFIADWLDIHGTEQWVDRLLDVMLIPLWHLLVHHGIALESHAQNLVLIHVQGWPCKIVLRDFHEDTEYLPDYLQRPDLVPDFSTVEPLFAGMPDDDGYRMASIDALRELFMDTVYVFNLTELSFVLAQHCGFDEERFWGLVRAQLRRYAESGVTDLARITRLGSGAPTISVESLLEKKLMNGDVLDFFAHTVANPLSEADANTRQ